MLLPRAGSLASLVALATLLPACQSWKFDAVRQVVDREHEWAESMQAHDFAALDDILAEEFRLTFVEAPDFIPPGAPPELPRQAWLDNTRQMTFGSIDMSNLNVYFHGRNVATVRMDMTLEDWRFNGELIPPDYELTDIWVRRDGRWQVVNRVSEPVEP